MKLKDKETLKRLGIPIETNAAVLYEINHLQKEAIVDLAERFNAKKVRLHMGGAAFLSEGWISGMLTLQNDTLYEFGVDPQGDISS